MEYRYLPNGSVDIQSVDRGTIPDVYKEGGDEDGNAFDSTLLPISSANILSSAYGGLYSSKTLLENEGDTAMKRFEQMKRGGAVMRSSLGWEEWLSAQGAVFYSMKGEDDCMPRWISLFLCI
jgi:hypothetical protein